MGITDILFKMLQSAANKPLIKCQISYGDNGRYCVSTIKLKETLTTSEYIRLWLEYEANVIRQSIAFDTRDLRMQMFNDLDLLAKRKEMLTNSHSTPASVFEILGVSSRYSYTPQLSIPSSSVEITYKGRNDVNGKKWRTAFPTHGGGAWMVFDDDVFRFSQAAVLQHVMQQIGNDEILLALLKFSINSFAENIPRSLIDEPNMPLVVVGQVAYEIAEGRVGRGEQH